MRTAESRIPEANHTKWVFVATCCLLLTAMSALLGPAVPAQAQLAEDTVSSDAVAYKRGLMIASPYSGETFFRSRVTVTVLAELGTTLRLRINGQHIAAARATTLDQFPGLSLSPQLPDAGLSQRNIGAWQFVSVDLQEGPNLIEVEAVDGSFGGTHVTAPVHVIGVPAKISVTVSPQRVPADGQTEPEATIEVTDEWGVSLPDRTVVRLDSGRARVLTEDLDPKSPGTQLALKDGKTTATLGPSLQVEDVKLAATINNLTAEALLRYTTVLPPFSAVALLTGKLTNLSITDPDELLTMDFGKRVDDGEDLFYDKRAALFVRGSVLERYLLTASYDSERRYQDRLFRQLTPDKLYPIYGDSSSIFFEAQSSSKGYLKIEEDRSYLLFGDYNTDMRDTEFSAYDRSLTGAKLVVDEPNIRLTAVGAQTKRSIVKQEIEGRGISGFYYLERAPVVEFSEKIRIEVRDRYRSHIILRSEQKYRFLDYDIDYEQGTIFFKQPVQSRNGDYDKVVIVVVYETREPVDSDFVAAGTGELSWTDPESLVTAAVGGSFIKEGFDTDASTFGGYQLSGVHGSVDISQHTRLFAEVAQSDADDVIAEATERRAWKVELSSKPNENVSLRGYLRDVGGGFANRSSLPSEIGSQKYGGEVSYQIPDVSEFRLEHYRNKLDVIGVSPYNDVQSTSGHYRHQLESFAARIGAEHLQLSGGEEDVTAFVGTAAVDVDLNPKLQAHLQRDQNFDSDNEQKYRPNATSVGLSYELTDNLTAYGAQKILDDALTQDDGDEESSVFDAMSTVLGIRSQVKDTLSAYSEYRIGGGISGEGNHASIGLRNRFRVHPDFTLNVSFERSRRMDILETLGQDSNLNNQAGFDAFALSGEYLPSDPVKASAKYEIRRDDNSRIDIVETGIDFKLSHGFSAIGKHRLHRELRRMIPETPRFIQNHTITGIAFRPENMNFIQSLAKLEIKQSDNDVLEEPTADLTLIGSIDVILQPVHQFELYGKYAIRQNTSEQFGSKLTTTSDLGIGRVRIQLNDYIDVAGEYRVMYFRKTTVDDRPNYDQGYAAELGIWFVPNLRTALGYNFRGGSQDKDFPESSYWAKGPFVRLSFKY